MPEYFQSIPEPGWAERYLGGWPVIASAWAIAVVIVMLFAGMQALASHHVAAPQPANMAGVMIPRHDPTCGGPGTFAAAERSNCPTLGDTLATAEADAEAEASYGW